MTLDTVPTQHPPESANHGGILAVVLVYAVFASCWILLSDRLVQVIFGDPAMIILVSILKGWLFVGITSLLLYGLMLRSVGGHLQVKALPAVSRRLGRPFIALTIVITVFTCLGIINHLIHHKASEISRLDAVADLKSGQIAEWLRERQDDADFVLSSDYLAELYRRWQELDDLHSGEQLRTQLGQLCKNCGFSSVMLLNPHGKRLWASAKAPSVIPQNLQAVTGLVAIDRKARRVSPYRDAAGHVGLDFILPLKGVVVPAPLIIMHINLMDKLSTIVRSWPTPLANTETLLFRRDGAQVLFLNELKSQKEMTAKLGLPITMENLLSARILRGEFSPGSPVEGVDYRGVRSVGVARAIPGTDWFLMVKLDQSELYAEAVADVSWFGFAGLLSLFMVGAGSYLLRQGQQLTIAQALHQSQAERLNALQLLAAIADSSDDAIFAKDLEGRFILFNRAASNSVGKSVEEVLGLDERSIFPPEQAEMLIAISHQVITDNLIHRQEEVLSMPDGDHVFLTTKGPLRDAGGHVIGTFGISREITERKQMEQQLRESEQFKHAILDSVSSHIAVVDRQGVIIAVNLPWRHFAEENALYPGHPPRNCDVGANYLDVCRQSIGLSSDCALDVHDGIRAVLDGRLPDFSFEYPCHSPMKQRWFTMVVTPLGDMGQAAVITHTDITGRRQAEAALRNSERRFRQLFDLAPVPLTIIDQNGVVLVVNERFISTFGYTYADAPTLAEWWSLAYPDPNYRRSVMVAWNASVQRAVERGTDIEPMECRITCKNGKVCTVVISGITIGNDFLTTFFDVSERRASETELLRRNDELERFNRAMVGRELDMIALKQQVNEFSRRLGQEPPYPLTFLDKPGQEGKPE